MLRLDRAGRNRLLLTMLTGVLLGILSGTTTAFAHQDMTAWTTSASWHVYPKRGHGQSSVFETASGGRTYVYNEDHFAWADVAYPDTVDFLLADVGFWDGWSSDPNWVRFGPARVQDEQGTNAIDYMDMFCGVVHGTNQTFPLNPNYETTLFDNPSNKIVIYWQEVWAANDPCPVTSTVDSHQMGFDGRD